MTDLTKRLREMAGGNEAHYCYKAADRIEQLERDIAAAPAPCVGNDPACPCQDGDLCHYKDSPDGKTKAWAAPEPVAEVQTGTIRWHIDRSDLPNGTKLYAHPAPVAAPAPDAETAAWMICEPGCEYGPTFGTENAAWSALTKAPPGSELVELIRRKA